MEEREISIRSIYRYVAQIGINISQDATDNLYILALIVLVCCCRIRLRFPNKYIDISIRISFCLFLLRIR